MKLIIIILGKRMAIAIVVTIMVYLVKVNKKCIITII